eukprot:scaffold3319_cov427-Prasinococcus_capsulatus_cf.AAC.12
MCTLAPTAGRPADAARRPTPVLVRSRSSSQAGPGASTRPPAGRATERTDCPDGGRGCVPAGARTWSGRGARHQLEIMRRVKADACSYITLKTIFTLS